MTDHFIAIFCGTRRRLNWFHLRIHHASHGLLRHLGRLHHVVGAWWWTTWRSAAKANLSLQLWRDLIWNWHALLSPTEQHHAHQKVWLEKKVALVRTHKVPDLGTYLLVNSRLLYQLLHLLITDLSCLLLIKMLKDLLIICHLIRLNHPRTLLLWRLLWHHATWTTHILLRHLIIHHLWRFIVHRIKIQTVQIR